MRHGQHYDERMAGYVLPDPSRDHIKGSPDAPAMMLEYGDFECIHCGLFYPIAKAVEQIMGENLCFAFRNFPLTNVHPHAKRAAEAAEAAGAQGSFWGMHDLLFENQDALECEDLCHYARTLGLDVGRFKTEVLGEVHAPRVREDFTRGIRAGVNGTPTILINGMRYDGPRELDFILAAVSETSGVRL